LRGAAEALATPARKAKAIESVSAFKAPLLDRILSSPEDPERRNVVLDLGAVSQAMIDRLSASRPCRIEIADLYNFGGLAAIERIASSDEQDLNSIGQLLPPPNQERLDLVFCWDLPNYLSLPALTLLIDFLSRRAAPGCRVHMLVAYSKREMAELPARYIPAGDGNLAQSLASGELTKAPRYSPEDLGRALGNFRYERGVLLANGMQEFVYAWPQEPGVKRPY
jgi:hypothetical protein